MRLAEALAQRAELTKRVAQLRARALAHRDALHARHRATTEVADAASRRQDRFTRTELRYVSAVDVPALRRAADDVARHARELDTRIQEVNWTTELST